MWRFLAVLACLPAVAVAAGPVQQPSRLAPDWQAKGRALFEQAIEIPTVAGRNQMRPMAELIAGQLRSAGFAESDIRIIPHLGLEGDNTVSLTARWRAERPTGKPILILAHMDVVEARREDWERDPFEFVEQDGYFYGRGTIDNKAGVVGVTLALMKLKAAGFRPNRDIIILFTGDEETAQNGANLGAGEWRPLLDAEFALNADTGGGAYTAAGTPLGFGLQTAEKTFQTYFFTVRNRGGHSSRPRPDNAIYQLAGALSRLAAYRFRPELNEATRAYFTARARQEHGPLGNAMRRWLANESDGAAADEIEASELEVGMTRTRCVATMLNAGHADNALPQMARATVNCRIMPGVDPAVVEAELERIAGGGVEVEPDPSFIGRPSPASPLRPDVVGAYSRAVAAFHGPSMPVIPEMSTGASDGLFFRAAGIPVYGVSGHWGISPEDERAHGLNERIPVRAFYDNILHWEMMLRELAGR